MKVCRLCRRYAAGGAERCAFDGGELHDAPVPPVAPGDVLGAYEVQRALAAGQTGVLLLCRAEDEREVVVKILNPAGESVDGRRAVLDSVSALTMEGLQPIEEIFDHDERICLVQQPLDGVTLAVWLVEQGPLSSEQAIALGRRLCQVLTVVHETGLVHLDIRPGHLFVPEGSPPDEAVLLDLGVPSPPGRLAPPELYEGRPDPEKTDVYGLCVTLFVTLAGRSPFRADTADELAWLVRNAPPPPLRVIRKEGTVDPSLERLMTWGMVKDAAQRPTLAQVTEVLEALGEDDHEAVERGLAEAVERPSAEPRPSESSSEPTERRRVRRRPPPAAADDDNPTMRIVRKILPASMLPSTGVTQAFFVEGEELEREMVRAAREEAVARQENAAAWLRLITLLLIALLLGGVTVWALTQ